MNEMAFERGWHVDNPPSPKDLIHSGREPLRRVPADASGEQRKEADNTRRRLQRLSHGLSHDA
jgi:hypothetical protein